MPETTLKVDYTVLNQAIAVELGFDPAYVANDASKKAIIDSIRQSAERSVYYAMLPEGQGQYEWSFTSPPATLVLTAGTGDYDLPDDFGYVGAIGPRLVFPVGSGYSAAEKVDAHGLLDSRARENTGLLDANITSSQTTLVVTSTTGFPTTVPFTIQIG